MLNHISIMGRLTKDPEIRHTNSGVAVTSFTLAVDRDFKNSNGEKETDFIEVVCWNGTAEFASKFFSKGKLAIVAGRLQMRKWQDKDGNKRTSAEVVADNVYFADSKKDEQENRPYVGGGRKANDAEMEEMQSSENLYAEELPF